MYFNLTFTITFFF